MTVYDQKITHKQQPSKKILDKKITIDKSKTMVKEYKDNAKKKPNNNNNNKIINKTTKKKPLEQPKIVFKTIEYDTNTGKVVYSGGVDKNGIFQGFGKVRKNSKLVYEGKFKDGEFHGRGKQIFEDGVYEGKFKDGEFHGRGKLTYPAGDIYEGAFKDGQFHGIGKWNSANGDIYEGSWLNSKMHGNGQCFNAKSKKSYTCSFKNGVLIK